MPEASGGAHRGIAGIDILPVVAAVLSGAAADAKDADAVVDGLKKSGVIKAKKAKEPQTREAQKPHAFSSSTATAFMSAKRPSKRRG
jgi:hypothetical protein